MLDEPLLVLIRYLSETLNSANPPCKLLMLESLYIGTCSLWRRRTCSAIKQYGDGQDYYHISDCSSNRLLPHFVTDISDPVLE